MIDGLKVSLTGEEFRELLDERAARYLASAAHWQHEAARTSDDESEDAPLLPEHMCKNEAAQLEWRAAVLTFLRERIDVSEDYRLGIADLDYLELLPAKPDDDVSELGPFAQRIFSSPEIVLVTNPDMPSQ